MPLTPQDIVRKEFREAFRGYNQSDVDLFLDEVVEEYTRIHDENQKMKVRMAALQQELARVRDGRSGAPVDTARVESEVRARVRRFLEEQIRLIDQSSSTAERVAREIPATAAAPVERTGAAGEDDPAQPFWAGE